MAEYKNWYLARGSGMKDERKKLKLIITKLRKKQNTTKVVKM